MKNFLMMSAVTLALIAALGSAQAKPFGHGGLGAGIPNCPQGSHPFDGCNTPGGTFQSATLLQDYAKDASGSPATLLVLPPQNVPGVHFKTGPAVSTFTDPQADPLITNYYYSWANGAGHTLTATLYISGPGPEVGMTVWDDPTGGTQYYPNSPKITAVTPSGTNLWVITTDQALTTHTGFRFYASYNKGCIPTPGTGTNPYVVNCNFQNSAAGASVSFPNYYLGAENGHQATVWRFTAGPGTVLFTNPKIVMDHNMDVNGGVFINASSTAHNIDLQIDNMEFDGGDESVSPGLCHASAACMPYLQQVLAVNWAAPGTAGSPEHITFNNPYMHDTAGNTLSIQTAYTAVTFQSPVWVNWSMNSGDLNGCTPPNCATGFHGSAVQFGGTAPGYENYWIHFYNPLFVWPYFFQNGITSCATCVLGGVGTVGTFDDIDFELPTVISNASNNTAGGPHAISAYMFNPFRIGRAKSYKIHGVYSTNLGVTNCFGLGGDLQSGVAASSVTNGDGKSATVTFTGVAGSPGSAPYPGQWINHIDDASHALRFVATTTARNLGDGTSNLSISSTLNGGNSSALAFGQGLGAKLINPHSTIVSGSGASYIISDGTGTGAGQTAASEVFVAANYLNAFGTGGTTAHQPPPIGNLNGTYTADGFLAASSNTLWAAQNAALDTLNTIDNDVNDNHEMTISGSGNAETFDDVNGSYGACPNTSPS
jgi:hypothetical protein